MAPPANTDASDSLRLYSLQALRALAAVLVVTMHTSFALSAWTKQFSGRTIDLFPWYNTAIFGACGVHLFFVISGFVIASQQLGSGVLAARDFAIKRVSRIAPLYWLCTLAYVAVRQLDLNAIWPDIIRSLLFSPAQYTPEFPVLPVGWTLNYEMTFYFLFAVIVRFGLQASSLILAIAIIVLTAEIFTLPIPIGRPIALEFAIGIAIFNIHRLRRLADFAPLIFFGGVAMLLSTAIWFKPADAWGWSTTAAWGIPSGLIILGAVSWERKRGPLLRWGPLTLLGDASYALYLLHSLFFYGNWNLVPVLVSCSSFQNWEYHIQLLTLITIIVAFSVLVHTFFEKPLTRAVRNILNSVLVRIRHTSQKRDHQLPSRFELSLDDAVTNHPPNFSRFQTESSSHQR